LGFERSSLFGDSKYQDLGNFHLGTCKLQKKKTKNRPIIKEGKRNNREISKKKIFTKKRRGFHKALKEPISIN
jgi:hypothetical protein